MKDNGSRLQPPPRGGERLEDHYGSIGIPALAAALGFRHKARDESRSAEEQRQGSSSQIDRDRFEAQS
jgi:hypothetical protein